MVPLPETAGSNIVLPKAKRYDSLFQNCFCCGADKVIK